jgi:hypothetical protein
MVWKTSATHCPQCDGRLAMHRGRGPRLTRVFFTISVLVGAPLGGFLSNSLDNLVLYHRMGVIIEVIGAISGVLLLYTFILLHNQRR